MVEIIFETHATTVDNEAGLSSGWYDIELSELGIKQAKELGQRYRSQHLGAVFCSDMQRSYKTAEIAFEGQNIPIIKDQRLRECDYGDLTRHADSEIKSEKPNRIITPYPNGESYEQATQRIKSFLDEVAEKYDNKRIMIIGHRATQYGLEHWVNGVSLLTAVTAPWHWQSGWIYILNTTI